MCVIQYTSRSLPSSWSSGADGRLAPHRLRRAALARLPRLRRGVRRTHARADVWERVRGVPRRRPALDTADDPMAVGMIGGSPLRGREAERDRRSRTSGASQRATTNSLGTTSQPCASLPPWHSGFNQLSLDPSLPLEVLPTQLFFPSWL